MNQQPQNLYQAQNGPIIGSEPLMNSQAQPMIVGQPMVQMNQSMTPMQQMGPIPSVNPAYQIPNQSPPIIVNQIPINPGNLKTSPVNTICPFCRNSISTLVEKEFNCLNCCFCCWSWPIWLIVQLVRDKELNCTDATHKCPNCGRIIGQYNAC